MEIEELLRLCVEAKASDLHLLPGSPPLIRVYGDLTRLNGYDTLSPEAVKDLIYSTMNSHEQRAFETNLVHEIALSYPGIGNFRASMMHALRGVAGVFRVIPEQVPTFEELALPNVFKRLLALSNGLILVTGPVGSGKTTTLAAMIDYVNENYASHVITIEDPIEYVYTNKKSAISQLQVGRDTPDIATALRASLRQDPNVILLGELRDLETIRLALTAAETGHLVLATLHASSAPLAISRMIDIFPAVEKVRVRNLLSETLQAVICQTLVKKTAGGRAAAFEIMLATPAIRHLVRQDMITHMISTIQTSGDVGMCTMEQYLQEMVAKRIITTAAARTICNNRDQFQVPQN